MRIARGSLLAFGLSSIVVVTACGVAPIDRDQAITLGPNEGIAAIVTYTYQPVTQLAIEPEQSSGKTLVIPNVQADPQIYLIPAPAGRYCFGSFRVGKMAFFAKGGRGGGCFEVRAGYISFSNPFDPSMVDSAQGIEVKAGNTPPEIMLRERYPLVAKQFPLSTHTN